MCISSYSFVTTSVRIVLSSVFVVITQVPAPLDPESVQLILVSPNTSAVPAVIALAIVASKGLLNPLLLKWTSSLAWWSAGPPLPPEHVWVAGDPAVAVSQLKLPPWIEHLVNSACKALTIPLWLDCAAFFLALPRKPPNAVIPTAARIPMIATTTKSSIKVKPFWFFLWIIINP